LVGRLENTPEIRYTSSGIPVSNFSLSVRRSHPNSEGIWEKDVFRIVTWRKLAETCCKYLERGRWIAVDGKLQNRFITTQSNERKVMVEIHADDIRFLDFRQQHRDHDTSRTQDERKSSTNDGEPRFKQESTIDITHDKSAIDTGVREIKPDDNGVELEPEENQKVEINDISPSRSYLEDEEGTPLDMSDM